MQNRFNAAINVYGEKIQGKGEDSYSDYITDSVGYLGVYGGCSALNAHCVPSADGETGAALAARLSALQVYKWFEQKKEDPAAVWDQGCGEVQALLYRSFENFSEMMHESQEDHSEPVDENVLAASGAMLFYHCQEEATRFMFLWAGETRGLILNSSGLAQLTKDDFDQNAETLSNIINGTHGFKLHHKIFKLKNPCIVMTATDGVYGQMGSPMEFEHMLLNTLVHAESFADWEKQLKTKIEEITGEDFCLQAAIFGFDSFEQCKAYYGRRARRLSNDFIKPMRALCQESENPDLSAYWNAYMVQYNKYL